MWNRAELKKTAKEIMKKNYWWVVVVSLIMGVVSGNVSMPNSGSINSFKEGFNAGFESQMPDEFSDDIIDDSYEDGEDTILDMLEEDKDEIMSIVAVFAVIFFFVFIFALAFGMLLNVFIIFPIMVGCNRWFIKNRTELPQIGEVAHVFGNGYKNVAKIMFFKSLYEFLWSMLFIIPGIVKSYEYRMVPYLLAENPYMDKSEAFTRSKNMMNGNKWDAFVLDLSFLGWEILSVFTCGILSIFYVNPYRFLTNTELYVKLCMLSGGRVSEVNEEPYTSGYDREMFN